MNSCFTRNARSFLFLRLALSASPLERNAHHHAAAAVVVVEVDALGDVSAHHAAENGALSGVAGLAVVFDGEVGLGDVATLDEEEFPIEEVADDGGFVPFGQVVLEVRVKGFLGDGRGYVRVAGEEADDSVGDHTTQLDQETAFPHSKCEDPPYLTVMKRLLRSENLLVSVASFSVSSICVTPSIIIGDCVSVGCRSYLVVSSRDNDGKQARVGVDADGACDQRLEAEEFRECVHGRQRAAGENHVFEDVGDGFHAERGGAADEAEARLRGGACVGRGVRWCTCVGREVRWCTCN